MTRTVHERGSPRFCINKSHFFSLPFCAHANDEKRHKSRRLTPIHLSLYSYYIYYLYTLLARQLYEKLAFVFTDAVFSSIFFCPILFVANNGLALLAFAAKLIEMINYDAGRAHGIWLASNALLASLYGALHVKTKLGK